MNIVIEGPDGSGKSTLARIIAQHVPVTYKPGQGPPKYPGEMLERVGNLLRLDGCLFDRHPCVSQLIYDSFRINGEALPQWMVDKFYESKPFFIYCYDRAGPHEIKPDKDTPEHLALIERYDSGIREAYHRWAVMHVPADQWYTTKAAGDRTPFLINLIKEKLHAP
jgi:energy-coupling factor transporter ATP-binding protein EcfA2